MTPETTVPADLFPGLLDIAPGVVWCGPVVWFDQHQQRGTGEWIVSAYGPGGMAHGAAMKRLKLPLHRPEARAQLCRVLAAGERCPECKGARVDTTKPITSATTPCPICHGSGYLRKPAPAWHLLPATEGGTLPATLAEHSPALLARHARIVAAGGEGIVGVLGEWVFNGGGSVDTWCRFAVVGEDPSPGNIGLVALDTLDYTRNPVRGWWRYGGPLGPETGAAGRACADAAALAAGYALLTDGVLVLPPVPA